MDSSLVKLSESGSSEPYQMLKVPGPGPFPVSDPHPDPERAEGRDLDVPVWGGGVPGRLPLDAGQV